MPLVDLATLESLATLMWQHCARCGLYKLGCSLILTLRVPKLWKMLPRARAAIEMLCSPITEIIEVENK